MTDGPHGTDPVSIPAALRAAAELHGDVLALVDGPSTYSYVELSQAARTFAASLIATGIHAGDRIAVWAPNSAEWVIAALGIFEAGAVIVPINTRFKGHEAADILGRSRARALVTVTDFLETDYVAMLAASGAALPELATTIVARGPVPTGTVSWSDFVARATPDGRSEAARRAGLLSPSAPSDILFTSGTTGKPKGVVQTHGRTLRVAMDWAAMTGLQSGDRYLMVNPYFHMFGLKAGILASVVAGATMLPEAVFDVGNVLRRVSTERVTVLPGPPTLYQSLLDHPERPGFDLTSLRVAVTGAADIPVELIRRIHDELPFQLIVTGYGLTEGGTAVATSPEDDVATIATTVGRPRPGFELRVVDARGIEVPIGESGEILLRGGSIMSHYLDDPEATSETLSEDGWLRTGDLGRIDERGCLRIVGRAKDMFIVGGFNAYPAEIENVLVQHPDVSQAAVIGVPDHRLGEVGMAFLVMNADATASADEVLAWARERMANYKAPRYATVLTELPLNATGKVVKDELRKRAATPA